MDNMWADYLPSVSSDCRSEEKLAHGGSGVNWLVFDNLAMI